MLIFSQEITKRIDYNEPIAEYKDMGRKVYEQKASKVCLYKILIVFHYFPAESIFTHFFMFFLVKILDYHFSCKLFHA